MKAQQAARLVHWPLVDPGAAAFSLSPSFAMQVLAGPALSLGVVWVCAKNQPPRRILDLDGDSE